MFCYGEKEDWYKKKVPSGMLPALELNGRMITESDVILQELENAFGVLHKGMQDANVVPMRKLERLLFRSWCGWLCYPARSAQDELNSKADFEQAVALGESGRGVARCCIGRCVHLRCYPLPFLARLLHFSVLTLDRIIS
jgi:glutathione S-transferase